MKNTESNKCPACGGDVSNNACPRCAASFLGGEPSAVQGEPAAPFHPPSPEELAPLFPQLEILELVGKGGMGAVYKARQCELDRLVALKILPPGVGGTSSFSERFAREAKALAKLNHPGIVTLYEFGSADGGDAGKLFFFLMEYVDGVNLRQMIRGGRMAAREALAIVPEICDALQFAHDHGIVHRDIKPENILIDRRGRVKVADFGLAKLVGDPADLADRTDQADRANLTQSGSTFGTPSYMSPEQRNTPGEVDHRADIYSLGVVIYEMLTGELPRGSFPAPSRKVAVDSRIDEIVLRTLERERDLRQQSADEVKTEMQGAVSGTAPQSAARKVQTLPQLRLVSKAALIGGIVLFIAAAIFTAGSTQGVLLAIAATAFVLGGLGLFIGSSASSVLSPAAAAPVTVRSLWLFLGGTTALVAGLIIYNDAPYVPVYMSGHQMKSVLMPDPSALKLGKSLMALGGIAAFAGWCGLWYALSLMKRGVISTTLRGFCRTCAWLPVAFLLFAAVITT